jgi:hypothetical protein
MKDRTKRILLIGGSMLILGGVAYYFLVYRPNHPKGGDEDNPSETPPADEALTDSVVSSSSSNVPSELNTIDKIKAFQDWMDTIGPWVKGADGKYKLLNKGAGYGKFGPSTSAAWSFYKKSYLAPPQYDEVTISADPALKSAIDFIVSKWTGDKAAIRKRLLSEKPDFVKTWYNALKKFYANQLPKNAFEYAGKVYDISYGKHRMVHSPIGKRVLVILDSKLHETPSSSSNSTKIPGNSNIGNAKDYRWNVSENLMFLYVPDNGFSSNNKWIYYSLIDGNTVYS